MRSREKRVQPFLYDSPGTLEHGTHVSVFHAKGYLVTTVYPLSLALVEHDVSFVFQCVPAWRHRSSEFIYS